MATDRKLSVGAYSVSASVSRVSMAKTPYERMLQVVKLSRYGRQMKKLAGKMAELTPLDLAERIAAIARSLGIETAVIGAYAMAAHQYVRGGDIDLATDIDQLNSNAVRSDGGVPDEAPLSR